MMTVGTPLMWTLFSAFVIVALAVDFFALNRQGAHKVSMRAARPTSRRSSSSPAT